MADDIPLPRRHSIRLPYYDYRQNGAYFITICALNRECLFGHIEDGAMRLNEAGHIAHNEWLRSAEMRREIALDEFVVMPNHLHGIVFVVEADGTRNDGKTAHNPTAGVSSTAGVHRTPLQQPAGGDTTVSQITANTNGMMVPDSPPGVHRTPLRYSSADGDGMTDPRPTTGVHRTPLQRPARASLGALINGYKASVTKHLTALHIVSGASVWQRNYYEHIIRNDDDLDRIRRYIADNPARWADDRENPAFTQSPTHPRPVS